MTDTDSWLWVTEAEVVSVLDMGDAIRAVREGFAEEARGGAENMVKTMVAWEGGNLHAIGGVSTAAGLVGTKTWAHTGGGANPLLILFDAQTGGLAAIIEAFALGQMRTGAVSGVATDLLARADATDLALVGTGKQALAQVAAVLAVRPGIERVRVHSRDPQRRETFAARVEQVFGVTCSAATSVEETVADADVITLVTRATEPFLLPEMVSAGAHINALGAITPSRQEFDPKLLDRCSVIATDSIEQVKVLSTEFTHYFGDGDWSRVELLSERLERHPQRPQDADLTLSKAMGTGLCDLALGRACHRAMVTNGLGSPMDQPRHLDPRLRADPHVSGIGYV